MINSALSRSSPAARRAVEEVKVSRGTRLPAASPRLQRSRVIFDRVAPRTVCITGRVIVSDASARYPRTSLLLGGATLSTQSAQGADWGRPVKAVARGCGFFSAQRAQDSFSSVVLGAPGLFARAAGPGSTTSRLAEHSVPVSLPSRKGWVYDAHACFGGLPDNESGSPSSHLGSFRLPSVLGAGWALPAGATPPMESPPASTGH